ncbi:hypothetical protein NEUTE1DRAFT_106763 [Neurospora tetrasperma FGSC 2508]|uniref:Uncharacterized protein n=1 Tax=Neurospora tetrasperma (strain FGSC 2508 / ATCC MYA-4615 / P0657) TaxID=510951 RepID=F8MAI2_NEUT8|nr:uncharacterized protein NEUTE1DRAFT_106763 [Neurospora tetrasperma FGSC 2508]EGO60103.1 hypothetical protein NEUTE1DRAFT_106763 [Neurospora tetrasperma FGSC 2508]EGZ75947.1 hypothetical protein NEUTE2DRAFT_55438 [Neurospora tetrasperma FGSC 2509]
MGYLTPAIRQTATGTLSTLPNDQTFAVMHETYHGQEPQYNVHPHSNGDLHCNPACKFQQRYLAEIQAVGEKAWQTGEYYTNGQTVILNSKVRPKGPWVNHAQLNQFRLQQRYQQHQQQQWQQQKQWRQQQQWQQIPPVPIVPQQRPAVCSAPSLGLNQFQTWAQPQQPGWDFVDKPNHVDLTSNYYDIGNHASSNFNNILTSQSTQQLEELKYDMGRSVNCPVYRTRSPPPSYTPASAPYSSAKGVGHHNKAPARSHPERRLKNDASRCFVNVVDPKAYPAALYHPRPQNGPQGYAVRRMIDKPDKDLRLLSELMKEEEEEQEEEQEYGQEECEEENCEQQDNEEGDHENDDYEAQEYEQEDYPTPTSLTSTYTSTPNTPQRPEEEEPELCDQTLFDEILNIYDNTWEYKSKPAITAALYKYKRTRLDRSKYVLDCLMDMVQVNSDEFKPPIRPDKNNNNNNNNHNNHNNMNDNNHNNNHNRNTTTTPKRKRRDSSSSWGSLFDSEEEDDELESASCGSSKRRHLNDT